MLMLFDILWPGILQSNDILIIERVFHERGPFTIYLLINYFDLFMVPLQKSRFVTRRTVRRRSSSSSVRLQVRMPSNVQYVYIYMYIFIVNIQGSRFHCTYKEILGRLIDIVNKYWTYEKIRFVAINIDDTSSLMISSIFIDKPQWCWESWNIDIIDRLRAP